MVKLGSAHSNAGEREPKPGADAAFLESNQEVHFHAEGRADIYAWVERMLRRHDYPKLSRADKGLVHRYVMKMTGRSRAQVTRMIGQFGKTQAVRVTPYRRRSLHASTRRRMWRCWWKSIKPMGG